jgi:TonB family protein
VHPCRLFVLALLLVGVQQGYSQAPTSSNSANGTGRDDAGAITRGVPIRMVNLKSPGKTPRKKTGVIVLHATIATDGSVKDATVVSGDPSLTEAAIDAARQWRYIPFMSDGSPVEGQTNITLNYDFSKRLSKLQVPLSPIPTEPQEDLVKEITTGEVFTVGRGVTPPKALYAPDPQYSKTAQKARYQGTVVLGAVVGADGSPRSIWVVRELGSGLDEKAIDAVRQWKFRPATKNGTPVAVHINVEVDFRLY